MIEIMLTAIALVLIVEGLAYALAPSLIEELLEALKQLPIWKRRQFGVIALALGVVLFWLAKSLGA